MRSNTTSSKASVWPTKPIDVKATVALPLVAAMTTHPDALREFFVVGLRNVRAVEKQALSIMNPQIVRLESYPDVADRLRAHVAETDGQIARVDQLLASFDTSASTVKDFGLSLTGGMAAKAQWIDETLPMVTRRYADLYAEAKSIAAKV